MFYDHYVIRSELVDSKVEFTDHFSKIFETRNVTQIPMVIVFVSNFCLNQFYTSFIATTTWRQNAFEFVSFVSFNPATKTSKNHELFSDELF